MSAAQPEHDLHQRFLVHVGTAAAAAAAAAPALALTTTTATLALTATALAAALAAAAEPPAANAAHLRRLPRRSPALWGGRRQHLQ